MPDEYKKRELPAQPKPGDKSRHIVRCPSCLQLTKQTHEHASCEMCGAKLSVNSSIYSGNESEDIITGADGFYVRPSAQTVDKRRHPRISCRGVKACIKTGLISNVVDVVNVSRAGLCFISAGQFVPGTTASIAMHYVEGGQNIFQNGRVIWAHRKSSDLPIQHGVEFSLG